MLNKRILFTGGASMVALNWSLLKEKKERKNIWLGLHRNKINLLGVNYIQIDLNTWSGLYHAIIENDIEIVVNTIAITDVDYCEKRPDIAEYVNSIIAKNIAIACKKSGCKLIHFSTDQIFDGGNNFYSESSSTSPLNVYGKTKLKAEQFATEYNPSSLIVRTNFFGCGPSFRSSFTDFIYKNLQAGNKIELYKDIFFTPIYLQPLIDILESCFEKDLVGIYSICGSDRLSKYDFGIKFAKSIGCNKGLIKSVSINDHSHIAKRPYDMSLNTSKISSKIEANMPSIDYSIELIKNHYLNGFCKEMKSL